MAQLKYVVYKKVKFEKLIESSMLESKVVDNSAYSKGTNNFLMLVIMALVKLLREKIKKIQELNVLMLNLPFITGTMV